MITFEQLAQGMTLEFLDDIRNGDYVTLRPINTAAIGVLRPDPLAAGTAPDRADYQITKGRNATQIVATPIGCPPTPGLADLKKRIDVSEETVACPMRGCEYLVPRQRKRFRAAPEFQCPVHQLYVSPPTFQLPSELHNVLDRALAEVELLGAVKRVKRESTMAREKSEDAVTWNTFRFLHKAELLVPWIESVAGPGVWRT